MIDFSAFAWQDEHCVQRADGSALCGKKDAHFGNGAICEACAVESFKLAQTYKVED